ncbi:MAG: hypothetical protein HY749_02670 [Gammaproteobacteria bacterium]|nr:hypothetical protein [Gammaproteobacteria bacterium]MBI5616513.1 hypothetical protein [Gammaproteobacteria bacterium]
MKKNATPELSLRWWQDNGPDGLDDKAFESALKDYESAADKLEDDEAHLESCLRALTAIENAAKKLATEAGKAAKTPPKKTKATPDDFVYTGQALDRIDKVVAAARKEAEASAEASDDGALGSPEAYKKYLKSVLRKVKARPMNFAVAIGAKAPQHRFVFHRTKAGTAMVAALRKETGLAKLSFGVASVDPAAPLVLRLALEGPQLPGLKKKGERVLKLYKPLPYSKIVLLLAGKEVEDLPDPEDVDVDDDADVEDTVAAPPPPPPPPPPPAPRRSATDLTAAMNRLSPALKAAVAANPDRKDELLRPVASFQAQLKADDLEAASRTLVDLATLIKTLGGGDDSAFRARWAKARAAWMEASDAVDAQIAKLQSALRGQDDVDLHEIAEYGLNGVTGGFKVPLMAAIRDIDDQGSGDEDAIADLRDIIAGFRGHLESDERIAVCDDNPFRVAVSIRKTLGDALAEMATALEA